MEGRYFLREASRHPAAVVVLASATTACLICCALAVTATSAAVASAVFASAFALNVWSALLFMYDKFAARSGDERIPELDLLISLAFGGEGQGQKHFLDQQSRD